MSEISIHPLKKVRMELNLSREDLAIVTLLSSSTIKRAENNEPLNDDVISQICEYISTQLHREVTLEELGLKRRRKSRMSPSENSTSLIVVDRLPEQPIVHIPNQYEIDETLDRLLRAVKKPSSIDEKVIINLEMMTKSHWQLYAGFENSIQYRQDMLYSVSGHLQSITQLINSTQPTLTQKRLYDLASETTQLIGEIFFDLKDNTTAEKYYNMSLELARETQNNVLLAVTLGRKSFIPIYSTDAHKALPFLQTAYTKLAGDSTNIIRAWLLAREAEVHANINDADACFRALEKAEFYLNAAQPGEAPSYAFLENAVDIHFTRSMLLGYKGACYTRLKKPSQAQAALKEDLTSMDPARAIHNGIVLVDLARAYVQQGEIEEAHRYANDALSVMVQLRSGRVFQRILNLRQELEPWKDTAYVQNLDEQISPLPYTT